MATSRLWRFLKWAVPVAILLAGITYAGLIYLVPFILGEEIEVHGECRSPDGNNVAVFYSIGGGGAAGYLNEFVAVHPTDGALRHRAAVFGMNHGYEVCFQWMNAEQLQITYPHGATAHWKHDTAELGESSFVQLEYRVAPAENGIFTDPRCQPCS